MTTLSVRRPSAAPWLGLAGLLLLAFLVYRPGLSGGFLFDDFVNLNALGATGRVDDWPAFWRYITSGTADPTGRPLSLLSFLIDARAWPADPAPFLRTNVLLHLLNGGLLFVLLRMLGARLRPLPRHVDAAALLGAALWLLHPLFVSTTLYVVQREAMLPATFILLGLILWVRGTGLLDASPRAGVAWMCVAILVCTPLAMLSKANGMLLPLLAWVLDATVLRGSAPAAASSARTHLWLRRVLLIAPSLVLFGYLAIHASRLWEPVADRPWSTVERLLTQSRVLMDYLQALIVPRVLSTGLYNDAYVFSRGLLSPVSTLLAWVAIAGMVVGAFALRKRAPALAAAVLFFFAGHLLESTVIPLELYFEHRNYLPAMLLGWPLALALFEWQASEKGKVAIALVLVALLASITWQRASLWAQQDRMAWLWAERSPESPRAQATAALFETKSGRADRAIVRLEQRAQARPGDLQLALNLANARCAYRGLSQADIDAVATALRTATAGDQLVYRWLGQSLEVARAGQCRGLTLATIDAWVAASAENPRIRSMEGRRQDLATLRGRLALAHGAPARALEEFDRALRESPTPQTVAGQAAMLATAGCYTEALAHLDTFATMPAPARDRHWSMRVLHARILERQHFWPEQLQGLRAEIAQDQRQSGNTRCAQ
jgi:hypothetical protein